MFRRTWQRAMTGLARSPGLTRFMQGRRPGMTRLAARFIAGGTAEDGVRLALALNAEHGLRASLFFLGETVDGTALVEENVAGKLAVAEKLAAAGLDVHVSLDTPQIGLPLDAEQCLTRSLRIAETIGRAAAGHPGFNALVFGMEDHTQVDATIALHDAVRDAGLPAALTLQAYLRRTEADLAGQIAAGGRVRLVKGAFVAGGDIAFVGRPAIKANFRRLIDLMFSADARESGFRPIVATHDERLLDFAAALADANGWPRGAYEFELLLGVRQALAERLAASGYTVRLYTPFGRDWWPYAMHRIGESPENALFLVRSLVSKG